MGKAMERSQRTSIDDCGLIAMTSAIEKSWTMYVIMITTGFRVVMVVNTSAKLRQHIACSQRRRNKRNLLPSGKNAGSPGGMVVMNIEMKTAAQHQTANQT